MFVADSFRDLRCPGKLLEELVFRPYITKCREVYQAHSDSFDFLSLFLSRTDDFLKRACSKALEYLGLKTVVENDISSIILDFENFSKLSLG